MPRPTKQDRNDPAARRSTSKLGLKPTGRTRARRVCIDRVKDRHSLPIPPQTDAVAWARMLAAARGADMIRTDGLSAIEAHPLTRVRLPTLLHVANELYEKIVGPTARAESQKIDEILLHCKEVIAKLKSLPQDKERHPTQWSKAQCEKKAGKLLVPSMIWSLQPAPPDAIGMYLTPQSSAWRLLRIVIARGISEDRRLGLLYNVKMHTALGLADHCKLEELRSASFVDAVFERAPPLVQILPRQWTSPDKTDELIEALLALVNFERTRPLVHLVDRLSEAALVNFERARPLVRLVDRLSEAEYDFLVKEHFCLSQILEGRDWAPNCDNGRSIGEYKAFAHFVRKDEGFKGSLTAVPRKRPEAKSTGDKPPLCEMPSAITSPESGKPDAVPWMVFSKRQRTPRARRIGNGELRAPECLEHDLEGLFDPDKFPDVDLDADELFDECARDPTGVWQSFPQLLSELDNDVGEPLLLQSETWKSLEEPEAPHEFSAQEVAAILKLERPEFHSEAPHEFSAQEVAAILKLERPEFRSGAPLTRSNGATVVSGGSVVPLAAAGAAFGLVIFLVALVYRRRSWRVVGGALP